MGRVDQQRGERLNHVSLVDLFICGLLVSLSWTATSCAQPSRDVLSAARIVPHVGNSLPLSSEFLDHRGTPVTLGDVVGDRPAVLCLVYLECPMLCKLATEGLVHSVADVPETVGQDFDILFVSFDPRDTPERAAAARSQAIRRYARDESADGWHFLTGSQPSIEALTKAIGFQYTWDEETKQFAHAAGLTIISDEGIVTEYLDGVRYSPRELVEAIHRAERHESSASTPTSFVRCYLYDPTTGRFGAAVQWTIRTLGLLTVVALAVTIYWLQFRAHAPPINKAP